MLTVSGFTLAVSECVLTISQCNGTISDCKCEQIGDRVIRMMETRVKTFIHLFRIWSCVVKIEDGMHIIHSLNVRINSWHGQYQLLDYQIARA